MLCQNCLENELVLVGEKEKKLCVDCYPASMFPRRENPHEKD